MRLTVVLLLVAVGFLVAALRAGHASLAWGSVALSVVAAAMILRRWRRAWLQRQDAPDDELVLLDDEPIMDAEDAASRPPASVPAVQDTESAAVSGQQQVPADRIGEGETDAGDDQPGEEDTDAADLLVIYELSDDVVVVDENPRYHLARCRWPDQERAERLPIREARELGFTPCDRCRPDTTLARKHRAGRATTATASAEPGKTQ